MIEPKPPPALTARTSSISFSSLTFGPARENHDASPVEAALDHMTYAIGELLKRNVVGLIGLLRLGLFEMRAGQFYLDDVGAELGRYLRGVGDHVECGLAVFADARATRIGPYHDRQAMRLGFSAIPRNCSYIRTRADEPG
jgi:hypothetical protein